MKKLDEILNSKLAVTKNNLLVLGHQMVAFMDLLDRVHDMEVELGTTEEGGINMCLERMDRDGLNMVYSIKILTEALQFAVSDETFEDLKAEAKENKGKIIH